MTKTFQLNFERSTKGAHLFTTKEVSAISKSMYIRKDHMPSPPASIKVTVEYE